MGSNRKWWIIIKTTFTYLTLREYPFVLKLNLCNSIYISELELMAHRSRTLISMAPWVSYIIYISNNYESNSLRDISFSMTMLIWTDEESLYSFDEFWWNYLWCRPFQLSGDVCLELFFLQWKSLFDFFKTAFLAALLLS